MTAGVMKSKRRVPPSVARLVDYVRARRERMMLFLRSLGWRSRSRNLETMYVCRTASRRALPRRSVVFLHNSYYHFYYLARALRKRGWDAVTVSLEDPTGPNALYYHGEDLNLFSKWPAISGTSQIRLFPEQCDPV